MERRDRLCRTGSRFAGRCALALGVFGLLMSAGGSNAAEQGPDNPFAVTNESGFGNCLNSYSWSMTWFKDRLYVGTNKGSFFQAVGFLDPGFTCEGVDPATDPAGEIWRYSPEAGTWELVFRSPTNVPVWGEPDTFTSLDNGFRDMIVFTEADGTEALYVAGIIYPFLYETRVPRILRSTDGVNFEAIPQDPGTVLGDIEGTGFRAMASHEGRLYVTEGSVVGEGIILEADDPAGGNDNFRQVSPPGMLAFELATFNDSLYVGSGEVTPGTGFQVLKMDTTPNGTPYHGFVPVVTNGAYGPYFLGPNNAVLSMGVFQGRLYVGGQNDLLRVNPDDSWDLVVGNSRTTDTGPKQPLSGLGKGFNNGFTGHLWRMEEFDGSFYVGTWDFAVFATLLPIIGPWFEYEAGFDLWRTEDGVTWYQITRTGFGDKYNHGVRSLQATPWGLFLGTVNSWNGTQVYKTPPGATENRTASSSSTSPTPAIGGSGVPATPGRLQGERRGEDALLSWEPSPSAVRFQIFRAIHRSNRDVGVPELAEDDWLVGPYTLVETTVQPFVAIPLDGPRATYYVQAEGRGGEISAASNIVMVPSFASPVTFDDAQATVRDMVQRQRIKTASSQAELSGTLASARLAAESGDSWRAQELLEALLHQARENPRGDLDALAAQDLEIVVSRLLRRVQLAGHGALSIGDVVPPRRPSAGAVALRP